MGRDVGKSLLNNPQIALTPAAAPGPSPKFPLRSPAPEARRGGEPAGESRDTTKPGEE